MEYFQKRVSIPILEKRCVACHTSDGLARHSKLVLATNSESNYLQRNFETVREIASYQYEGQSLLLLKPTGHMAHGGGEQIAAGSEEYEALRGMLGRFQNPDSCQSAPSDAKLIERVEMRDLSDTLRHAKLQLVGELPSDDEQAVVADGGEEAFRARIADYVDDPRFEDSLRLWLNDMLHTDKYLGGESALNLLDGDDYPNRKYYQGLPDGADKTLGQRYANDSVAREPLDLIVHVVRNNRPFTEILTADYTVVNPYSARVFGVDATFADPTDPSELVEARVPGVPHAGLLTSPMFLNRFPTTDTNVNRHRARMVMQFFLATDILKAGERPLDPAQVSDHNPTMNNPQCTVCHAELDPLAGSFQNWDDRGRFRPPESGWFDNMRPPGFGEEVIPVSDWPRSLSWVAQRIATDERFAMSAVHLVYRGLTGRSPVESPTDPTDPRYDAQLAFFNIEQEFLSRTAQVLIDSGYNFKSVVPEVLLSPFYRASSMGEGITEAEQAALANLGTSQLLTPERLSDRIVAVTGYPWRYRVGDADRLLNHDEFLFFYGGIDSDQITSRVTEPNGLMANIGYRMANEMGCLLAPREFGDTPMDRRLLHLVEPSYEPEDVNGFVIPEAVDAIKATIVHLHAHVLGEHLTTAHPQVDATYELFYATWREGKAALAAGEVPEALPWHCQHRRDFWTDAELPEEERLTHDPDYTIRAWAAVLTYLMSDFRFLYE